MLVDSSGNTFFSPFFSGLFWRQKEHRLSCGFFVMKLSVLERLRRAQSNFWEIKERLDKSQDGVEQAEVEQARSAAVRELYFAIGANVWPASKWEAKDRTFALCRNAWAQCLRSVASEVGFPQKLVESLVARSDIVFFWWCIL